MTQTQHFTAAGTYTVSAGITRIRPVVAGGVGGKWADGSGTPGRGAILSALISTTAGATFAVGAGQITGGNAGAGKFFSGGKGGAGSFFDDIFAGAGGGYGPLASGASNDAGAPGVDAADAAVDSSIGVGPGGGKADGSGGPGGTRPGYSSGAAGKSRANGGAGGNASGSTAVDIPSSGGGGGFGGGGGGAPSQPGAGGSSSGGSYGATLIDYNTGAPYVDVLCASAPQMPKLVGPIGNAWVDRTGVVKLVFQHSAASADDLDAQSDAQVRYRLVGSGTWTTVTDLGTATLYGIAAGTLTDGQSYEWQATTFSDGLQSPWSSSEYFTAGTPPTTPVITAPTSGQAIGTAAIAVAWTHPGQVMYQARVVNDVGGFAPASPAIYADSGPITSTAQAATLTVKVNTVDAHVQVRVQDIAGGLWSQWADVPVSISWEPPAMPQVYQQPDPGHGSIVMRITNPAPTGTQPAPTVNRIFITEGGVEKLRAVIAPGMDWEYWAPVGEVGVRVEAVDESTGVLSSTEVIW